VRIPEACRLTGIGRSKLYELIRAGEIRVIKVGTITLVPISSLPEFLGLRGP
jgi:excisionase family DNA binding protein